MSEFFKTLLPLISGLDTLSVQISVSDAEAGILTVSLLPRAKNVKDDAIHKIKPLVLRGTVEELDAEFLTVIQKPIEAAKGLYVNLTEFEASVAKAKEKSDMAEKERKDKKEQAEKDKKTTVANDSKADGMIIEADELFKEKKAPDAIKKLTKFIESTPLLSEAKKKAIETKIESLKKETAQESLFATS